MKRLNLTLLLLAIFAVGAFAQEVPAKSFKNAKKRLFSYYSAPAKNTEKLQEAKDYIDAAIKGIAEIKEKNRTKVYKTGGEIYLEVAKNKNLKAKHPDAAVKSLDYVVKSAEDIKAKSSQKDFAVATMIELGGTIFREEGNVAIGAQEWKIAQKAFQNVLLCKKKIDQLQKLNTFMIVPSEQDDIKFYVGYAAYNNKDFATAKEYLEPLAKNKFDESFVYSFLSDIYQEEKEGDKAVDIINQGVSVLSNLKFDNIEDEKIKATKEKAVADGLKRLLFAKINYFLTAGKLNEAEGDLKKAMEEEKDNPALPYTLGQIYSGLADDAFKADKEEEGEKYFASSVEYFTKTLTIKPDYFDAVYQTGALYFNEAVRLNKIQAELDYKSKTYTKDFEAMNLKIIPKYEEAWKYFLKAEKIKPNDQLLIAAFKTTYLRAKQDDAFAAFAARLKALEADPETKFEAYDKHPEVLFKKK